MSKRDGRAQRYKARVAKFMNEMTTLPLVHQDDLPVKPKKAPTLLQPAMRFAAPRCDADIREQLRAGSATCDVAYARKSLWPRREPTKPFLGPDNLKLKHQAQMQLLQEALKGQVCYDFEEFEKRPLPALRGDGKQLFKGKDAKARSGFGQRQLNADEFERVTLRQSLKGRNSKLGNTVYHMRPAELLRTLHQKSYFKACQTI